MFLVRCPKCKNTMKYQPAKEGAAHKKRCVYCGFSMAVDSKTIVKKLE
jgi:Zn ribbon nucleic-acid-binding protein